MSDNPRFYIIIGFLHDGKEDEEETVAVSHACVEMLQEQLSRFLGEEDCVKKLHDAFDKIIGNSGARNS